jgi:hypothetical protein
MSATQAGELPAAATACTGQCDDVESFENASETLYYLPICWAVAGPAMIGRAESLVQRSRLQL